MDQDKNRVRVNIYGQEYVMKAPATSDYVIRLAEYVDKKMRQIAERDKRLGLNQVAVLCALNLADELFKLQEQYELLMNMFEKEWDRLKAKEEVNFPYTKLNKL